MARGEGRELCGCSGGRDEGKRRLLEERREKKRRLLIQNHCSNACVSEEAWRTSEGSIKEAVAETVAESVDEPVAAVGTCRQRSTRHAVVSKKRRV